VLAAALSLSWLLARLPPNINGTAVGPWLSAAVPLCMVDLLRQFDGTYGSVMLSWWSSDIELGLFRAAVSCSVVVSMPVTILHIIYAPAIARLHRSGDRNALQLMLGRIGASTTVMVGSITAGCILLGRPLINLVFGPAYDGSWAPLTALCLAQLGFALFGMGPILLAMCHRERQLTRIYLAAIAGAMITALLLVEPLGATGVAAAQIVSLALIGGLSWWDGRRSLGVDCSVAALIRR
jgi:O-antigen/teichoic acid export membrane protein